MSGGANRRETAVESTAVLIRMVRLVHNHLGSSLRAAAVAGRAARRSEFCHQDADNVDQEESVCQHRQADGAGQDPRGAALLHPTTVTNMNMKQNMNRPNHSEKRKTRSNGMLLLNQRYFCFEAPISTRYIILRVSIDMRSAISSLYNLPTVPSLSAVSSIYYPRRERRDILNVLQTFSVASRVDVFSRNYQRRNCNL